MKNAILKLLFQLALTSATMFPDKPKMLTKNSPNIKKDPLLDASTLLGTPAIPKIDNQQIEISSKATLDTLLGTPTTPNTSNQQIEISTNIPLGTPKTQNTSNKQIEISSNVPLSIPTEPKITNKQIEISSNVPLSIPPELKITNEQIEISSNISLPTPTKQNTSNQQIDISSNIPLSIPLTSKTSNTQIDISSNTTLNTLLDVPTIPKITNQQIDISSNATLNTLLGTPTIPKITNKQIEIKSDLSLNTDATLDTSKLLSDLKPSLLPIETNKKANLSLDLTTPTYLVPKFPGVQNNISSILEKDTKSQNSSLGVDTSAVLTLMTEIPIVLVDLPAEDCNPLLYSSTNLEECIEKTPIIAPLTSIKNKVETSSNCYQTKPIPKHIQSNQHERCIGKHTGSLMPFPFDFPLFQNLMPKNDFDKCSLLVKNCPPTRCSDHKDFSVPYNFPTVTKQITFVPLPVTEETKSSSVSGCSISFDDFDQIVPTFPDLDVAELDLETPCILMKIDGDCDIDSFDKEALKNEIKKVAEKYKEIAEKTVKLIDIIQ